MRCLHWRNTATAPLLQEASLYAIPRLRGDSAVFVWASIHLLRDSPVTAQRSCTIACVQAAVSLHRFLFARRHAAMCSRIGSSIGACTFTRREHATRRSSSNRRANIGKRTHRNSSSPNRATQHTAWHRHRSGSGSNSERKCRRPGGWTPSALCARGCEVTTRRKHRVAREATAAGLQPAIYPRAAWRKPRRRSRRGSHRHGSHHARTRNRKNEQATIDVALVVQFVGSGTSCVLRRACGLPIEFAVHRSDCRRRILGKGRRIFARARHCISEFECRNAPRCCTRWLRVIRISVDGRRVLANHQRPTTGEQCEHARRYHLLAICETRNRISRFNRSTVRGENVAPGSLGRSSLARISSWARR